LPTKSTRGQGLVLGVPVQSGKLEQLHRESSKNQKRTNRFIFLTFFEAFFSLGYL